MGGRLSSAIWTQSRITDLLSSGETDIFFSSPGMYFKRPCRGREIGGGMDDCICTLHEKGNENSEIASVFQQINSEGGKIMGRKLIRNPYRSRPWLF